MIVERQCLLVLHTADALEFVRADGEYATGPQRIRIPGASIRRRPGQPTGGGQSDENEKSGKTYLNSHAHDPNPLAHFKMKTGEALEFN